MMGRPSSYSKELAEAICFEIATTLKGIRSVCEAEGMPHFTTVVRWLQSKQEFRDMYAAAKAMQQDFEADEMKAIADDDNRDDLIKVQRDKLRVDTRKWLASKLAPKVYGERNHVDIDVKQSLQVSADQFAALLTAAKAAPVEAEDVEYEELPATHSDGELARLEEAAPEDPDWL
jgi:hypothetical protein